MLHEAVDRAEAARPPRPRRAAVDAQQGTAAFSIVLGMLIVLVVFMAGTNFVVYEYGQGAVRTAVDEAARAGAQQQAPGGPINACNVHAAQAMGNLLPGPFANNIHITCTITGANVVATATGSFPGWLPPVPALAVHIVGSAQLETNPTPS